MARASMAGQRGPSGEGLTCGGDGYVNVRLARLRDARQRRGRGRIDDVERVAVLALGPAPPDEQPERPPVPLQPLERRLVALGRGPIRHRLEDLAHRGHADLLTAHPASRIPVSYHRVAVRRGVPSRYKVLELALDVREPRRGAEPEQVAA